MPEARPLRLLVAAHSHPGLTRGGAEIAAFHEFEAFRDRPGWQAWFLGCRGDQPGERLGAPITQPFSEREFVYRTGAFDWLRFANRDPGFPHAFRALLAQLRPDVVHFHHFINFGMEAFHHVRQVLPAAKIVLTVHEYLLLCHHYGQMVTRPDDQLCYEATPLRCHQCFPDTGPGDFFLRRLYIDAFLAMVDHVVVPSHFLAQRLAALGLAPPRLSVIENVIPLPAAPPAPPAAAGEGPLRVGFFGQISRLKGINVLFDAAAMLEAENCWDVAFEIHGQYRGQPPEFQEDFLRRLAGAGRNIRFHGPYEPQRVDALMRQVDVTIVPSIWWENSPVVIQEAFRNRRPVICSDIGGMAEKVRDGEDGWHFPAGSAIGLVALLKRLCRDRDLLRRTAATLRQPPAAGRIVEAHAALFTRLTEVPAGRSRRRPGRDGAGAAPPRRE